MGRPKEAGVLWVLTCAECDRAVPHIGRTRPTEGHWPLHRCGDGAVKPFSRCDKPTLPSRALPEGTA